LIKGVLCPRIRARQCSKARKRGKKRQEKGGREGKLGARREIVSEEWVSFTKKTRGRGFVCASKRIGSGRDVGG